MAIGAAENENPVNSTGSRMITGTSKIRLLLSGVRFFTITVKDGQEAAGYAGQ